MSKPIRETRVLKLVFIMIPCLKFWALTTVTHHVFPAPGAHDKGCTLDHRYT